MLFSCPITLIVRFTSLLLLLLLSISLSCYTYTADLFPCLHHPPRLPPHGVVLRREMLYTTLSSSPLLDKINRQPSRVSSLFQAWTMSGYVLGVLQRKSFSSVSSSYSYGQQYVLFHFCDAFFSLIVGLQTSFIIRRTVAPICVNTRQHVAYCTAVATVTALMKL